MCVRMYTFKKVASSSLVEVQVDCDSNGSEGPPLKMCGVQYHQACRPPFGNMHCDDSVPSPSTRYNLIFVTSVPLATMRDLMPTLFAPRMTGYTDTCLIYRGDDARALPGVEEIADTCFVNPGVDTMASSGEAQTDDTHFGGRARGFSGGDDTQDEGREQGDP